MAETAHGHRIGWIGVGRIGRPLATRLLEADCDLAVYNLTRAKADALAELGAAIVDEPRGLVFTALAGPADVAAVKLGGESALLAARLARHVHHEAPAQGPRPRVGGRRRGPRPAAGRGRRARRRGGDRRQPCGGRFAAMLAARARQAGFELVPEGGG